MKILIFAYKDTLKNTGGPSGYLYNLASFLDKHPCDEIEFLDRTKIKETFLSTVCTFLLDAIMSLTKRTKKIQFWPLLFNNYIYAKRYTKSTIEYFNSFDAIHMHATPHYSKSFRKNKVSSKLIITTHCPEPVVDEMSALMGMKAFVDNHPRFKEWILRKETNVYEECDHIMFPVAEAREPYENASSIYKKKFQTLEHKFFYVPTALNTVEMNIDNEHVLDKYNLSDNALRLCYIGRHNQVKGYEFLKSAANRVLKEMDDVYFVIGGMKDCKIGLDHPSWFELGWVKTPLLLNEVDAFVLPNKETYFDLILLEVLRQGTPVILSRTGGNKWFEGKAPEGMMFFDYGNEDQFLECIRTIQTYKADGKLEDLKEKNRQFCQNEFNMSLYVKRYLFAISQIL